MEMEYHKQESRQLARPVEYKVYGSGGTPLLAFPIGNGRFFDWENNGMCAALGPWLETGLAQLICVDGVDGESWLAEGPERPRAEMQERWFNFLCLELLPTLQQQANDGDKTPEKGAATKPIQPLLCGAEMGALNAVNVFLRRPALFGGVIALDGNYAADAYFRDEQDDLVYRNTPALYLPARTKCAAAAEKPLILCCGRGPGEENALRSLDAFLPLLEGTGLAPVVDRWGEDVTPDWYWWQKEIAYFAERVLGKA